MVRRPNILLIMTDQQRADSTGYASPQRRGGSDTPNLDRLAAEGVIFDSAYSSSTSCVPARASLLTGLLHHRVPKVASNARALTASGLALKEGFWTIAHALRDSGYQTALLGKMHFQPIRAEHGFETMHICEHLPAGYQADESDDYRKWLESTGRTDGRFIKPGEPSVFPYESYYHPTSWITRQAIDFLSNRDRARPYFAVVSYAHPHTPYDPPEPYASMYPPEDESLPETGFEVNGGLPRLFQSAVNDSGPGRIFTPKRVDRLPEMYVRRVLAAIRALVKQIDDGLGEVLRHVDLSDTVVFFLSDHGDYGGHRGFLGKVPWIPFDDLVRVPFLAVGHGVAGGRRVGSPVQSFDYVPTALEFAGVEPPTREFDCESLAAVLHGADADPERTVFSCTSEGWPVIRRGRYKDIWHSGGDVHILYDMEADPIESRNLAGDRAYAPLLDENTRTLRDLMAKPVPDLWISKVH